MNRNDSTYVLERMRALCSRREYCSSDILKKASQALDGNMEEAQKILSILIEDKYLDDRRYASAYARDKAAISGWGITKIRYMLSSKGISRDIISEALEDIDQGRAENRLEKLLEHKYKSLKDKPQSRIKLLRFALGRGYSYDEIIPLIDKLISQEI